MIVVDKWMRFAPNQFLSFSPKQTNSVAQELKDGVGSLGALITYHRTDSNKMKDSEVKKLTPILLDFIKLMNEKYEDFLYVFHSTKAQRSNLEKIINKSQINNTEIISDDKIKDHILKKSIFAVSKSGTISLEISKRKIPSIIIYKMNFINFLIVKMLVKIKYANILNIAAGQMIIPELLQSKCNPKEIYKLVSSFLEDQNKIKKQISNTEKVLESFRTKNLPTDLAADSLRKSL